MLYLFKITMSELNKGEICSLSNVTGFGALKDLRSMNLELGSHSLKRHEVKEYDAEHGEGAYARESAMVRDEMRASFEELGGSSIFVRIFVSFALSVGIPTAIVATWFEASLGEFTPGNISPTVLTAVLTAVACGLVYWKGTDPSPSEDF